MVQGALPGDSETTQATAWRESSNQASEPLVRWIDESKVKRLQGLRVKRLGADLTPEAPERLRRQALEQLAALAAAGGSEERAARKEGLEPLQQLLGDGSYPLADRPGCGPDTGADRRRAAAAGWPGQHGGSVDTAAAGGGEPGAAGQALWRSAGT